MWNIDLCRPARHVQQHPGRVFLLQTIPGYTVLCTVAMLVEPPISATGGCSEQSMKDEDEDEDEDVV